KKFGAAEGLRNVVISSCFERRNPLLFRMARAQNNNSHRRPRTDAVYEIKTVSIRQTQIENANVWTVGLCLANSQFTAVGGDYSKAVALEQQAEYAPQDRIVFHNENSIHSARHVRLTRRPWTRPMGCVCSFCIEATSVAGHSIAFSHVESPVLACA